MNDNKKTSDMLDLAFGKALKEFGTSVPQLSIVITIIIGSLQFDAFFNAGVWTITSILCFSFLSLFKRHVSPNVMKTFLFSIIITFCLVLPIFLLYDTGYKDYLIQNKSFMSMYSAVILMIPLGLLISSYKKQELMHGLYFPTPIENVIERQLTRFPFYRKNINVELEFIENDNTSIIVKTKYSYTLVNRTKEEKKWKIVFDIFDRPTKGVHFYINNSEINIKDRANFKTNRGYEIERMLGPKEEISVLCNLMVEYNIYDSELYTTYNPATDFSLSVKNSNKYIDIGFDIHYENYGTNIDIYQENGIKNIDIPNGLLPYEGVYLRWKPNAIYSNKEGDSHE